jgi:hypothetical protein
MVFVSTKSALTIDITICFLSSAYFFLLASSKATKFRRKIRVKYKNVVVKTKKCVFLLPPLYVVCQ